MQSQFAKWVARLTHQLFEAGVAKSIFEHARNLVVATLVLAVGLEALESDPEELSIPYLVPSGYLVTVLGAALLLLNLAAGLHRLSRTRRHYFYQGLLVILYVVLFWRVTHLILLFR